MSRQDQIIRELFRMVRVAVRVQDEQVDRLAAIDYRFKELSKILGAGGPAITHVEMTTSSPDEAARHLLVDKRQDGSFVIAIDDGEAFKLAAQLAELLLFLASAEPEEDRNGNTLVGFRSRAEILTYIEKRGGKRYRAAYVNNLAGLLKKTLKMHDPRALVVTHPRRGVRFMLRLGSRRGSS